MRTPTVKVEIPVLARLVLSEIAERRGLPDGEVLTEMIRREAVAELGRPSEAAEEERDAVAATR